MVEAKATAILPGKQVVENEDAFIFNSLAANDIKGAGVGCVGLILKCNAKMLTYGKSESFNVLNALRRRERRKVWRAEIGTNACSSPLYAGCKLDTLNGLSGL